jgi:hypothetical protein
LDLSLGPSRRFKILALNTWYLRFMWAINSTVIWCSAGGPVSVVTRCLANLGSFGVKARLSLDVVRFV